MDGIILTIPNDQVFEATQYALEHDIPVLVFNTGLDYAKRLGLTRVLQDDQEAATMLGQELRQRGYERPLVIQLGDLDNTTFYHRFDSLQNVLDHQAVLLPLHDYNNTAQPLIQVRDTFLSNGTFDSIVSLGGSVSHMNRDDFNNTNFIKIGVDIVAGAVLDLLESHSLERIAAAFFDVGGSNMTRLFTEHQDTIGISQLPYYQTALPVFYMYLRVCWMFFSYPCDQY